MSSFTPPPALASLADRSGEAEGPNARAELRPEVVIMNRSGDVLIKHTVLKADHFPACHNLKLTPIIEGAPNFRKVDGLPVYGVAIPTVTGLRNVMNAMDAANGKRKVYWQNLREEPLIFINGHPFVVREADQPYSNLEYTGIDRTRVEDMEARLKADILAEAKNFGNQILVVHENEDLSLYDHWEPVSQADVQTPTEVYAELIEDGYDVDYIRIPVTDEKAPKDVDFEELITRLWNVPTDAALIFNCQMGRGRTTTGMIIASILALRKMDAFPFKMSAPSPPTTPEWLKAVPRKPGPPPDGQDERLKAGMYGVVRSLLRALEKGPEAKLILDAVVDAASGMQNLREAIASYRSRFLKEKRERQRNTLLSIALEYLERYYMLIAFTAYVASPYFDYGNDQHVPFPKWIGDRAELRSIIMRLLRRNSMAALELHVVHEGAAEVDTSSPSKTLVDEAKVNDVVAQRTGGVLGPFTILKEDNFPGMRSAKVPQVIEGAPNFRRMGNMPVFGLGMPTLDGIISSLKNVSGSASPNASKRVHALWINMREEPVVYINGRPFVLREEVRPLKNMMEYAGIVAARLESMEERLKKDVLAEALKCGGKILVACESFEPGQNGELYDKWEEIDHPDAVLTPAEVYAGLTKQGFAVKYVRIPVTDGTAPILDDIDALVDSVMGFGLENPVIFNCQSGIGRSTTGMVMAGMMYMYSEGALEAMRQQPVDFGHDEPNSPRVSDDEEEEEDGEAPVWDLDTDTVELREEQKALASGGYVGVRRIVRLLEEGDNAKKTVDSIIDLGSSLINLRKAILKYCKPRQGYKYARPELQQIKSAFKCGSAYLERYCMLIAFAFYLEHVGPETMPFSAWVNSRPDLQLAFASIQQNPSAALAPVPISKVTAIYQPEGGTNLSLDEQRKVLSRRRGRTLTRRTILKSYLTIDVSPLHHDMRHDMRQVEGLPIFSVGSLSSVGLEAVLEHLGGKREDTMVLISDVREEMVIYINGTPHIRRELEMPAAALHHAGIYASQLEELETLLKEDVIDEVGKWGGKILLHRELPRSPVSVDPSVASSPIVPLADGVNRVSLDALKPPSTQGGLSKALLAQQEDVTAIEVDPSSSVAAYWSDVNTDVDNSLMTTVELIQEMSAKGFNVSYRRIPMSRERTPEPSDIAQLQTQLLLQQEREGKMKVAHLILSRRSTGSSARFAAATFSTYHLRTQGSGGGAASTELALDPSAGEFRGIMSLCRLLPGGFVAKLTVDQATAQCTQIGNILQDIRKCRKDMEEARKRSEEAQVAPASGANMQQFAARQLGVHYLKRYFLLIAFRCFLEQGEFSSCTDFATWASEQKELDHLLSHLALES